MFNDRRDPDYRNKRRHYRELREIVLRLLERTRREVIKELREELSKTKQLDGGFWARMREYWAAQLQAIFTAMASQSADTLVSEVNIDIDLSVVNEPILRWSNEHVGQLIKDIDETTRRTVARAVNDFYTTPGMTMGELINRIDALPVFNPYRAEMIAVTETTAAYSAGQRLAIVEVERESGFKMQAIWNTNNDDIVCPICQPLNRVRESPGGGFVPSGIGPGIPEPPAHPNCRCWITHEIASETDLARQGL